MNDKGLLDWISRRKEGAVGSGSRNHVMAVLDVVLEMQMAVEKVQSDDKEAATKSIDRLMLSESEADRIEDRLRSDLSSGDMSVREREDLLHFVHKTDSIANWVKEASTYLQIAIETDVIIPDTILEDINNMATELVTEVKYLTTAVLAISSESTEVMNAIDSVKDQERVIDGIYYKSIKHIVLEGTDYVSAMLSREMIHSLEEAADAGDDCGDTLNVLLVSRRM